MKPEGEQLANASQNSPQTQLQPILATPKPVRPPRSNKSPAVKAAVIAKRTNGEAKRQIARDLRISRPTVSVILEEADLDRQMTSGKLLCAGLVPKAITAMETTLDKGDGYLGIKLLTGLGILGSEGKPAKPQAPTNLHLQIMNLVGKPITENKAVSSDTSTIAVPDNSAIDV